MKKFEERLPIVTEIKEKNLIAIDETVVKANKKRYSDGSLYNKKLPHHEILYKGST